MKIPMDSDTSTQTPIPDDSVSRRLAAILAQGGDRLLELQSETAALLTSESMRQITAPGTAAETAAALWQLPAFYGALFDQMTQHTHQSCQIISHMNNEIVEWVRESAAVRTAITVQAMTSLTEGFAERRTRSVVISFPDRRGMIAAAKVARDRAARNRKG